MMIKGTEFSQIGPSSGFVENVITPIIPMSIFNPTNVAAKTTGFGAASTTLASNVGPGGSASLNAGGSGGGGVAGLDTMASLSHSGQTVKLLGMDVPTELLWLMGLLLIGYAILHFVHFHGDAGVSG